MLISANNKRIQKKVVGRPKQQGPAALGHLSAHFLHPRSGRAQPGNGHTHSGRVFSPQLTQARYLPSQVWCPVPRAPGDSGSVRVTINSTRLSHLARSALFLLLTECTQLHPRVCCRERPSTAGREAPCVPWVKGWGKPGCEFLLVGPQPDPSCYLPQLYKHPCATLSPWQTHVRRSKSLSKLIS